PSVAYPLATEVRRPAARVTRSPTAECSSSACRCGASAERMSAHDTAGNDTTSTRSTGLVVTLAPATGPIAPSAAATSAAPTPIRLIRVSELDGEVGIGGLQRRIAAVGAAWQHPQHQEVEAQSDGAEYEQHAEGREALARLDRALD